MNEPEPVLFEEFLRQLPPPWPETGLRQQITHRLQANQRCIVALDDDPTGTQTVHDVWVLTRWDVPDLVEAFTAGESCFYILTNSRSLPAQEADHLNRTIAANLAEASRRTGRPFSVVSRSDSTLRGHFPVETEALAEALRQAEPSHQPCAGVCLIPFFPEGGRYTVGDIHWVREGDRLIPAAQTPYARDPVFGYAHSALPDWIEEKTGGRLQASQVVTISLDTLRKAGPPGVVAALRKAGSGSYIAVNAAADRDLEVFVLGLFELEAEGRRYLFRSAASFVKILAGITDRPLLTAQELASQAENQAAGGLIVVGSYVPKSSAQLDEARQLEGVRAIELPVEAILQPEQRGAAIAATAQAAVQAITSGQDALIFTTRGLVTGTSAAENLAIGKSVSEALMEAVRQVNVRPRYVIGKGGITSSDLATRAMEVRRARVLGQVRPGVPVWRPGEGSRWPGMVYVVFPGNVGDAHTLAEVIRQFRKG